jgi:hypothetical protein
MAGSVILTSISQLQEQRKGFEAISITNFDTVDTTAPEIALGSRIEIAGSVVQFTANEALLGFAGLGAGVCYAYIAGVALTATWTATAPTWSTEKQGYYDVTGANRYFMRCVKDVGGNYLQKALYTNIRGILRTYTGLALNPLADGDSELRLSSTYALKWNNSLSNIENVKASKIIDSGAGTELKSESITGGGIAGTPFYIRKPICCYMTVTGSNYFYVDIYQNSGWREIVTQSSGEYFLNLLPGYYRFRNYSGTNLIKLFCTGVYGSAIIDAASIIG